MASSEVFEVVLNGGAPWGFRLQGGKEFRAPLRIAKVTPNSKAERAGIMEGWLVRSINSVNCEEWTHSDALNSIKKSGATLKLILCSRKPTVSSPESYSGNSTSYLSSALTTDDINRGGSSHISRATFKPSDSDNVPSYATMPRGGERAGNVIKRWREVEENNNENAFISEKGEHMASDSNEWNPDIISGVVRPPEPIKLVHNLEAIRSVTSSSTSSEPGILIRAPETSRGFTDKPRPIGRGGRRFDDRGFQTTGSNPQLHSGSVGSEEDYNMRLANGDASSLDSAPSGTNRPAIQQFRKQKEQAAVEATKEPRPIRTVPPPTQTKPARKYSEERKMSDSNPLAPHRPSIQRGGKWYKEMFKELHSNAGTSSNLSGLLASDVAKGTVRDSEGGSGSFSPPRSASPSPDHQDNEVFTSKTNFVQEEPVRHTYTNQVSSKPSPSLSSSEIKPSRPSVGHVPAWYKDMQKGVEVPVQKIEEPESYTVKKSRPSADISKERRIVEPVPFSTSGMNVPHSHTTYTEPQRSPNSVTVQMEEKNKPPSATSLYESRFQRRQGPTRTASEELQVRQQPPSDEEMIRRREEEARRRREEEEWRLRMEQEERRREEEILRKEEEERQRREYEAELRRRREEEEALRREAKPQFMAWALYSFQSQSPKELSFRKGDIITVRRRVDKNWIDGELNGRRGIFPANYVELRPVDDDEDDEPATPPPGQQQIARVHVITQQQQQQQEQQRSPPAYQQPQVQQVSQYQAPQQTAQSVTVEGEAQVRYTFKAETTRELPCSKGDIIALVRKVDKNWYEGRIRDRKGIVPSSYLEVFREPSMQVLRQEHYQPVQSTRLEQIPDYRRKEPSYDQRSQEFRSPPVTPFTGHAPTKTTQVKYIEEPDEPYFGASGVGVVAQAVVDEPMRLGHVQGERFRALYSYEPENDDELRLEEGDEVIVLEKCDDGWFVGTSSQTNLFGTFPGNYVERIS